MANLKYPAGMKGKASLGWLGGLIIGFCPIMMYYPTYIAYEHYNGTTPRHVYGEEKKYLMWIYTDFRHSLQLRETIYKHPQYEFTHLDNIRLKVRDIKRYGT